MLKMNSITFFAVALLLFFLAMSVGAFSAEPAAKPWQGGSGTNSITKSHNGCIVNENFRSPTLNGISLSIYDQKSGQWHQTWMDNQGGYYDFFGLQDGDNYIFQTTLNKASPQKHQRMIFTKIKEDSFVWLWQKTDDNGESWQELWKINYVRQK